MTIILSALTSRYLFIAADRKIALAPSARFKPLKDLKLAFSREHDSSKIHQIPNAYIACAGHKIATDYLRKDLAIALFRDSSLLADPAFLPTFIERFNQHYKIAEHVYYSVSIAHVGKPRELVLFTYQKAIGERSGLYAYQSNLVDQSPKISPILPLDFTSRSQQDSVVYDLSYVISDFSLTANYSHTELAGYLRPLFLRYSKQSEYISSDFNLLLIDTCGHSVLSYFN